MSNPINLLAIDTAGAHCSVALLVGDKSFFRSENSSQRHSRHILGMIDHLMVEAEIQPGHLGLLAWSAGPGSFTGLRIGASVIQVLAYSFGVPVLSLSSLEIMAHKAWREVCPAFDESVPIAVAMDARMNGVYWARFIGESGVLKRLELDQLLEKNLLKVKRGLCGEKCLVVGDGWQLVESTGMKEHVMEVTAADVMALALTKNRDSWLVDNPADCLPHYVHNTINWQKRRGRESAL